MRVGKNCQEAGPAARNEMRNTGIRMLREARALRAAFPHVDAMCGMTVSAVPAVPHGANAAAGEYHAALRHLWDEMLVVRAGQAGGLTVLDDEIACVERLQPPPCPCTP